MVGLGTRPRTEMKRSPTVSQARSGISGRLKAHTFLPRRKKLTPSKASGGIPNLDPIISATVARSIGWRGDLFFNELCDKEPSRVVLVGVVPGAELHLVSKPGSGPLREAGAPRQPPDGGLLEADPGDLPQGPGDDPLVLLGGEGAGGVDDRSPGPCTCNALLRRARWSR